MRAVELHTEDTEDDIKSDYGKKHIMTHNGTVLLLDGDFVNRL